MIIDVFGKYGWVIPLKTSTVLEVTKAFRDLWKTQKPPQTLWTDNSMEFYNKSMKDLLEKNNVKLYSTENEENFGEMESYNQAKHVEIFHCKPHG